MLHIALYAPEIPPNTGNIMRLCANTGSKLHLINPLGFSLEEKQLRRAGMDYRDLMNVSRHEDFEAFLRAIEGLRLFILTTKATKRYTEVSFQDNDCLLFGNESSGLPEVIRQHSRVSDSLTLPMREESRSLNLSNCAAIVTYEAWRQLGFSNAK